MKTLVELQDEHSHKVKSQQDTIEDCEKEDRAMTVEEQADFDQRQSEIQGLEGQIAQLQETLKRKELARAQVEKLNQERNELQDRVSGRLTDSDPPATDDADGKPAPTWDIHKRTGKLKAFKGPNAERNAYMAGQWLHASIFGNERAQRWCQRNGVETRALGTNPNAAGGALVPDVLEQAMIDLREEYGVLRQLVTPYPMSSDLATLPRRADGVTASFGAENTAIAESDATFNNVHLTAKKLGVLTRVSTELAEDAIISIIDWLAQEFAYAFAYREDLTVFTGTGTAAFGSIVGINVQIIDGTHTAGANDTATANVDTFAEVTATDLGDLMGVLPQYAHPNAKFICSRVCYDLVFSRLAVAGGGNTIATLQGGPLRFSWLGYPVAISQVMPTSTGSLDNLVMLLFGDLSKAVTLGERRGITIGESRERYFVEDQIALKATSRIDIAIHDLGDNTTAGPVVAMIGTV
jgi:HK97 family phage major capsid protein